MFWILFIAIVFRNTFYKYLTHWFPSLKVGEFEIDEDLDTYYNTIDEKDRNWSIMEEMNCRKVMNMKILNDETLNKFETTTLKGIPL